MSTEKLYRPLSGWLPLLVFLAMIPLSIAFFAYTVKLADSSELTGWAVFFRIIGCFIAIVTAIIGLFGLMAIQPNEARVLLLFGDYKGSVRESGFFWVNPFFTKTKISLRVRNFETGSIETKETKDAAGKVLQPKSRTSGRPSKVNDRDGNPIDISAVVVWKVVNTAEALFEVDDYEHYVAVQSEAALRSLAVRYPYDSEDHEMSLRGSTQEICEQLKHDIQERLDKAGVDVIESRISHLAYAQEIAAAMLQRQQAHAVVAARAKIVEGAVGMVQMALDHLQRDKIVELDDERKAAMVSNLLVVLCSDRHTQPIVNAGSLYN